MRRRRILITGAAGNIGSAFANALKEDHDIVGLDIREPEGERRIDGAEFIQGTFCEPGDIEKAIEGAEIVIHTGGFPGWKNKCLYNFMRNNALGTFNMLYASEKSPTVEHFIYISSITWFGLHGMGGPERRTPKYLPIDEKHPTSAIGYYESAKQVSEFWVRDYTRRCGKPAVIFRPSRIILPQDQPDYAPISMRDSKHVYDYVGTTDFAHAVARAIDYHPPDGVDLFLMNADDTNCAVPSLEILDRFYPNVPADREKLSACDGFGAFVNNTHARDRLGWTPKWRCRRDKDLEKIK